VIIEHLGEVITALGDIITGVYGTISSNGRLLSSHKDIFWIDKERCFNFMVQSFTYFSKNKKRPALLRQPRLFKKRYHLMNEKYIAFLHLL
jgi:hypothetical protein